MTNRTRQIILFSILLFLICNIGFVQLKLNSDIESENIELSLKELSENLEVDYNNTVEFYYILFNTYQLNSDKKQKNHSNRFLSFKEVFITDEINPPEIISL